MDRQQIDVKGHHLSRDEGESARNRVARSLLGVAEEGDGHGMRPAREMLGASRQRRRCHESTGREWRTSERNPKTSEGVGLQPESIAGAAIAFPARERHDLIKEVVANLVWKTPGDNAQRVQGLVSGSWPVPAGRSRSRAFRGRTESDPRWVARSPARPCSQARCRS